MDRLPTGLLNDHAIVHDGTVLSARTLGPRLRTKVATLASSKQLAQKSHDAWNLGRREEGHDVLSSVAASSAEQTPGVAEQTCHTSSPVTELGSRLASNMMSMSSAGDPRSFDSDAFGKCV
jgi:hypothetical protein